jgi:hypothetical protein
MMTSFSEQYRSTFAALAEPLVAEDGLNERVIMEAEHRLGIRLPDALREYYLLAGRFDRFNRAHNRLLRPEQWSIDNGKVVFLVENQAVIIWGVEATGSPPADPPVFQAVNEPGVPSRWELEHERCSEFLLVELHLQAVWGGLDHLGMGEITPDVLERFLSTWLFAGRVQDVRAYYRDGSAVCVLEDEGKSQLYVGGRTEREFEAIESELERLGVGIDQL